MNRRLVTPLILFVLFTMLSCDKTTSNGTDTSPTTATTGAPSMKTFRVKLSVSGAAHLVDDVKPPFFVIPNLKREAHTAFLTAIPDGVAPNGLPNTRDRFDMDAVDPATGKPKPKKTGVFKWGAIPDGVEIDLEKSGVKFAAGGVTIDVGDQSNNTCPDKMENGTITPSSSLHWVPRLWRVSKAKSQFKWKASFTAKDPKPRDVLARHEVHGGKLEPEFTQQQRAFAFRIGGKKAQDDVVQAVTMSLAHTFDVELPANDPVFILKGRKFGTDGSHPGDIIELGKFKPFPGSDRIEIILLNMPLDEFFNVRDRRTLPHFHLYYRIVDGSHNEAVPEFVQKCSEGEKPDYECGPTH